MVAYNDISQVTALHDEQNRIIQGMTLIDAGGLVSTFTILPPAPEPGIMNPTMMMSVMLSAVNPSPAFMTAIRDSMTARSAAITSELAALGVTDTPPDPISTRTPAAAAAGSTVQAAPPSAKR